MKNVLIVHAHPEEKSFCSALMKQAADFFKSQNCEVKISDLYAMNFNPVGGKHDFHQIDNKDFFKYQAEQVNAFQNNLYSEEVKSEMEKFIWCDTLIFTFPLWWFSMPAIMKGWVDRIFAMGFAYGAGKGVRENGAFKDKTAFCIITTGGPKIAYVEGKNGNLESILFPIHYGIFHFVGMQVKEPFISFSPARLTEEERILELNRLRIYLSDFDKLKKLY